MTRDNYKYIDDIKNAIEWILNDYTLGMDYYEFLNDQKSQDAVVRRLQVVGEATNKLPDEFLEKHGDIPYRKIIAMRNILVHEYNIVDVEKVWKTVKEDLPDLLTIVNSILAEEPDEND